MKKIIRSAAALLVCGAVMSGIYSPVSAEKANVDAGYRKAYKDILAEYEEDGFQGVYIGDLVGDERDELLVATNEFGMFDLYMPYEKSIKHYTFGVVSVWGFTKYIKADRKIICLNYYGHTESSPYNINFETFSVDDNGIDLFKVKRDWQFDGSYLCTVGGEAVSDADFTMSLHNMIAETARSEYIPLVRHEVEELDRQSLQFYEGEILDISYDDYIKEKLG